MIQSKAIELLRTFSEDEIKEFGLFISSPFFNKEKAIINFYGMVKKYHPEFEGHGFKKEKVFAKLFPGKKYNDGMMRNILSKTLSLAENFLVVKNYKASPVDYNLALMEELGARKQETLFKQTEAGTAELMEKEIVKDEQYYSRKFLLNNARRNFALKQKSGIDFNMAGFLLEMQDALTLEYLIAIFRNASFIKNSAGKMYRQEHDDKLLIRLEAYVEENKAKLEGSIYLMYYYYTYKLATVGGDEFFHQLKRIMKNNYGELSGDDKKNIYVILTNYCYTKANTGDERFRKEHFELLREHVEKGYYYTPGGFMSHIYYMSTVITGLGAGETEWVDNFIEKHKAELDETNKENTYIFSRALFYYHMKAYDKALDAAARVETNDLSYKHQLKSFYLKLYFDMNETEPFYSHVDNYRHFISGKGNASRELRENILHYINFTKRLFDIKGSSGRQSYEPGVLKREIKESHSLINKEWLLKKISEIM